MTQPTFARPPRASRSRALLAALVLALPAISCGGEPEPRTPEPPAPPPVSARVAAPTAPVAVAQLDPVATGMTIAGAKALCDDHLAAAQSKVDQIKRLKGAPASELTYASTLGAFDDVVFEVESASQFNALLEVAHPDAEVRATAKACGPKATAFQTGVYLDADLAAVLRAYAAKSEPLEGERKRQLADTLRDFRRNGLELPADKQATLRDLSDRITKIGQQFEENLAASGGKLELKPKALDGLPADYVKKHPPDAKGMVEISTDYPDYFPFETYAKDRKAALDLYVLFTNRGGDENVKLLGDILDLRHKKAELLGYASWADYAIEPRMAKTSKAVHEFLDHVQSALAEPIKAQMAELMKEHVALGGKKTDKLPPGERYYLSDRVRASKYAFDSKELSKYFETGEVVRGLLGMASGLYGLEFREVAAAEAPAWHADVRAFDVFDKASQKKIGRFYLDLFPRKDKYKHAAMFPIVTAKRLSDGSYQLPVAALECNFPKPGGPGAPAALMTQNEVSTFFHEFGHVLHHLLTTSELATYAGTNTVQDFVEAPSQMFEEWTWSREVLDQFARHYQTGAKIPDALFDAMTRSRGFGRALDTARQLFLARLDLEYHSRTPPFDTTKVLEEVQAATEPFVYVKGTHFQSSFGHLIGYDAGYYSYQWALSLSRDVLTRFKKEGLLNAATAAAWRRDVLSKGGGEDEREMLGHFLGRPPNDAAYLEYLGGKD